MLEAAKTAGRRHLHILAASALAATLAAMAGAAQAAGDITGVWMIKPEYIGNRTGLIGKPELTQPVLDMQAKRAELSKKGYVRTMGNMLCLPSGGPSMFTVRSPFEIMSGFGRISFIFETEGSNQPRTVYLNEKEHGPNIYPSFNGHSIGHWEGDTLVVDTIGFNGRGQVTGGVPKSTQTHLVERFSKSADGKVLTAVITVDDPVSLKKPYTATLKFDRFPDTEERFEVWCEPDLEAFKTLNLEELKDGDPEVARMLNPDLRPTDPAVKIAEAAAAAAAAAKK